MYITIVCGSYLVESLVQGTQQSNNLIPRTTRVVIPQIRTRALRGLGRGLTDYSRLNESLSNGETYPPASELRGTSKRHTSSSRLVLYSVKETNVSSQPEPEQLPLAGFWTMIRIPVAARSCPTSARWAPPRIHRCYRSTTSIAALPVCDPGLAAAGHKSASIPSRAQAADSEQNPISIVKAFYQNHGQVQTHLTSLRLRRSTHA
jgi:hypothetical protein